MNHSPFLFNIINEPITTTWDNFEDSLKGVLDLSKIEFVQAQINVAEASKPIGVSPTMLSKLWFISDKLAEGAIDQNNQVCRNNADNALSRQFTTNDRMLRYKRIQSTFYSDTMFDLNHKSVRQFKCCQVFVSNKGLVAVYPMKPQKYLQTALHWFCKQVGILVSLVVDGHLSQASPTVRRFCDQVVTTFRLLETGTPWENRAELYIGLLKEAVRRDMHQSNSPMTLWCYCIEREAKIHNSIPRTLFQAHGRSPHVCTFGVQGDIYNICNFGWYEWVYYRDLDFFRKIKKILVEFSVPQLMREMRWHKLRLLHRARLFPVERYEDY